MIANIISAATSPANKLIDAVTGAIGKAYEPTHVRKMADAKAYEIKTIGQALQNNTNIPIEYTGGNVSANTKDFGDLVKRAQSRLGYQEICKQQNIESVTQKAYLLLSDEKECSEEPVDKDWMIRFFNSVEDISDEDMQNLWAKILAGEVKQPKSFSLRTLETLKNLSKDEALLFEKLCKLKITIEGDSYFPNYQKYWKQNDANFDDFLLLTECGLISAQSDIVNEVAVSHERIMNLTENRNIQIMVMNKNKHDKVLRIKVFPFTKIGIEISKLFECDISDENLLLFAKNLRDDLQDENSLLYSNDFELFAYKLTDLKHEDNLLD